MKSLLLLIVGGLVGCAQTQLTTPATIRSNAAHTTGGHLIINDSNDTTGLDVQVRASGVVFTGRPATNGNIVLAPGNVAGSGTVQILAPRVNASTLTLADASGTTTVKSLILKTFGGTEYFTVTGGTDSTSPGLVRTHNLNPIGTSDTIGFGVGSGSAYHFGYFEHADIRETDGTSSAIYAATNSSSAQHAIFAESINGTGEAIRANVRAGSTGDAIQALTNGGGGAAIRAIGNIISGLAGTYDIGAGIQDWLHVYAVHGDFRENDGLSSGVYATTNSASAQRAVFAEGINGTGDVIRANARAGSSGVALHAITNGGGGVAILASGGGITDDSMAGGGTQCVQVNNVGHLAGTGSACGSGGGLPVVDTTSIVFKSGDPTALLQLKATNVPTGSIRAITAQNANYTIAGTDIANLFTSNQEFDQSIQFTKAAAVQWQMTAKNTANFLEWRDSSSNLQMSLDASGGTPGGGILLTTPSITAASTSTTTPTLTVLKIMSQSADVVNITDGGTKYLEVNSSGNVLLSSLAGGGTQCVQVNNSGQFAGAGAGCGVGGSAWTSYTPTITHISGPTYDCAYSQSGKWVAVRVHVNGVSDGTIPTFTLPVTAKSSGQNFPGYAALAGAVITFNAYMSSTTVVTMNAYNNTAVLVNTSTYDWVFTGVYEAN